MEKSNVYDKNIKYLKKHFLDIAVEIDLLVEENNVIVDESLQGEKIFAIENEGRICYLNSRYNDKHAAMLWAEQYNNINPNSVVIMYGLSNFSYVKAMKEYMGEDNKLFLLYEPDPQIFLKAVNYIDIESAMVDNRMFIVVGGMNEHLVYDFLSEAIDYGKLKCVERCCMPGYEKIYAKGWSEIVSKIKQSFEIIIMDKNTQLTFSDELINNMLANYEDIVNQYTINQLYEKFVKIHVSDIPAIIVSAGPSLDKNIKDLKEAKGKSFIIAVDTALKALADENIIPDIAVTVDPHKNPTLFMYEGFNKIPLLVCQHSNKTIWALHNFKRFYFGDGKSYMSSIYLKYNGEELIPLETGGSVANCAFSFAQLLGFKRIILVGQDLGYTDNIMHVSSAYGNVEKMKSDRMYVTVEDIYGGHILTDKSMEMYLKWFEKQIVRYSELDVIDATEGGALIHGTTVSKLSEAIAEYCSKQFDAKKIIDTINPAFDERSSKEIRNELDNLSEILKNIKPKINKGIRYYEKIRELYYKRKTSTGEYNNIINKINDINIFVENEPIMEMVSIYNRETEYDVMAEVYNETDNESNEIKFIVDTGIKMLESYKEAIDKLINNIKFRKEDKMEEIYDTLQIMRIDFMRFIKSCRIQDYYKANQFLRIVLSRCALAIDKIDVYNKNHEEKYDISVIYSMLNDIYACQKKEDYISIADSAELYYVPLIYDLIVKTSTDENSYWSDYESMNMKQLRKVDEELSTKLDNIIIDEEKYICKIACSGDIVIGKILENGNVICLNSLIDPFDEKDNLMNTEYDEEINNYFLFGFDQYSLRIIFNKSDNINVIIYESDIQIIKLILKYSNLAWILETGRVKIIYDPEFEQLSGILSKFNGKLIMNHQSIASIKQENIKKTIESTFISISSIQKQRKMLEHNFVHNILSTPKLLSDVKDEINGKRVLYIAGGPSLDDDIECLKDVCKKKMDNIVIISAGTVLNKLVKENIIPNFVILSDAKTSIVKQIDCISKEMQKRINLLYLSSVSDKVVEIWNGEKYMILQKDFSMAEKYAQSRQEELCETGGSVSTLAVDVALRAGCISLICVGLDLAYTHNKTHANNTKEWEIEQIESNASLIDVMSTDGGRVKTGKVYEIYRKFIENRIYKNDNKVVIYNTSSGANISGMQNKKLNEIIV